MRLKGLLLLHTAKKISGTILRTQDVDSVTNTFVIIDRIISRSSILTPNKMINLLDRVDQYIQWEICHHYRLKSSANWYSYQIVEGADGMFLSTYTEQ